MRCNVKESERWRYHERKELQREKQIEDTCERFKERVRDLAMGTLELKMPDNMGWQVTNCYFDLHDEWITLKELGCTFNKNWFQLPFSFV